VDKPLFNPFISFSKLKGAFHRQFIEGFLPSHLYASNAGFPMCRKLGPRLTLQNDMFWKVKEYQ